MRPSFSPFAVAHALRGIAMTLLLAVVVAPPCQGQPQIALTPATLSVAVGGANTLVACIDTIQASNTTVQIGQTGPTGLIAVPPTATIFAGDQCTLFAVSGLAVGGPVTVTATLPVGLGGGTDSSLVTVGALGISLLPTDLAMQLAASANLTIVLSAPAAFGGVPVAVTQAGPAGVIDFTWTDPAPPNPVHPHVGSFVVTIPAGTTTFAFLANALAAGGPVTVIATLAPVSGGASATAEVTVGTHAFAAPTGSGTGPAWVDVNPGGINRLDSAFTGTAGLQLPVGVLFPHGAMRLHVVSCPPGGLVNITWGFPTNPALGGAQLWKLDRVAAPVTVPRPLISVGQLQYVVQDGGPFDGDGMVNGDIVDPAAIGAQTLGIPVMRWWGITVFLLLLAVTGAVALRRLW